MSPASFDTPSPNQVEGFPIPDMREVINSNVWNAALGDDVAMGDVSVDNVADTAMEDNRMDKAMRDNATNDTAMNDDTTGVVGVEDVVRALERGVMKQDVQQTHAGSDSSFRNSTLDNSIVPTFPLSNFQNPKVT